MSFDHAVILALIEGITEFLPISSTGHMILAAKLLNIPQTEFAKSFEIIIQLGAIMAVASIYMQTLFTNKNYGCRSYSHLYQQLSWALRFTHLSKMFYWKIP